MKASVKKFKEETPQDVYAKLIQAAKIVETMNSISVSSNREKIDKIKTLLNGVIGNGEKSGAVAENILKQAEKSFSLGMDGRGTYFID